MQKIEIQEVQKFKEIPQQKYSSSEPILAFILYTILTILVCLILFIHLESFNFNIYDPRVVFDISWFSICLIGIIRFLLSYFMRKNASIYHIRYYRNVSNKVHIELGNETFCRGCGIIISNEIFRDKNRQFIKPKTFFLTKGYYCKKCYKKYHRRVNIGIFLLIIFLYVFLLQIFRFYQLESLPILWFLIFYLFILIFLGWLITLIITNYVRLIKTFK